VGADLEKEISAASFFFLSLNILQNDSFVAEDFIESRDQRTPRHFTGHGGFSMTFHRRQWATDRARLTNGLFVFVFFFFFFSFKGNLIFFFFLGLCCVS
jgi:hypothetical protein